MTWMNPETIITRPLRKPRVQRRRPRHRRGGLRAGRN